MPVRAQLVGVLVAVTLAAASCSSDGDGTDTATTETALFDRTTVHDIEVTFDQDDYDAMVETYAESGEKEWIEATVTIDGDTYDRVGLRLKGNSSLMGLRGGTGGPPPDAATTAGEATARPGPGGSASADEPESLPWLIRLDELVEGQDHQGYEDIVIRSNGSQTSLNEAVALDLLEEAGLSSQKAAPTSFRVNGGDAVLRLAIENPDDDAWQEANFDTEGALYKAESTGDWSYRGDDPADYDEVFDQEGGSDVADMSPLIELLQFLDESDDATFAAELAERLDVDAFATYLAMMELLGNFDDIDGPGNNAYLWYDRETEQFTIVPWDMNLALGSGFGGEGGFEPPEGFDPGQLPEGVEPPTDGEVPEGVDPGQLPEGVDPGARPGGDGGFGRSNVLVERFHAHDDFEALYQQELTDLRADLYESGVADESLAGRVDTLIDHATDLVDEATITDEAEAVRAQFTAER